LETFQNVRFGLSSDQELEWSFHRDVHA